MHQKPPSWMEHAVPIALAVLGLAALIALVIALYVIVGGVL